MIWYNDFISNDLIDKEVEVWKEQGNEEGDLSIASSSSTAFYQLLVDLNMQSNRPGMVSRLRDNADPEVGPRVDLNREFAWPVLKVLLDQVVMPANAGRHVVLAGHSLGGQCAALHHMWHVKVKGGEELETYTFAMPGVYCQANDWLPAEGMLISVLDVTT